MRADMNSSELQGYLEFAKGLAVEAGIIMKRYFRAEDIGTEWKEDSTPVTVADTIINKLVIDRVKEVYPEFGIIGEEDSHEPSRDYVWVVDPIDGTIPFSLGIPVSTFCLALVYKGDVQISVVFEPFQDRLFSAMLGGGAFMNDKKIHVSSDKDFKNKYLFGSSWVKKGEKDLRDVLHTLREKGVKTLNLPSYSYMAALVASGEFVAAFMTYGSQWDAAAISLIVEEAGGKASDLNGQTRKYHEWGEGILLTNGVVHDDIVRLTKNANTWD